MKYSDLIENTERTPTGVKKRLYRYIWSKFREIDRENIEIEASNLRKRYEVNKFCFSVRGDYIELCDIFERLHSLLIIEGCDIIKEKYSITVTKADIGTETATIENPHKMPYDDNIGVIDVFI